MFDDITKKVKFTADAAQLLKFAFESDDPMTLPKAENKEERSIHILGFMSYVLDCARKEEISADHLAEDLTAALQYLNTGEI